MSFVKYYIKIMSDVPEEREGSQSSGQRDFQNISLRQTKSKQYHDHNKKDGAYKKLLEIYKSINVKSTRDTVLKRLLICDLHVKKN